MVASVLQQHLHHVIVGPVRPFIFLFIVKKTPQAGRPVKVHHCLCVTHVRRPSGPLGQNQKQKYFFQESTRPCCSLTPLPSFPFLPSSVQPSAGAAPDFPRIPSIWSFLGNTRDRTANHRKQSLLVSAATGRSPVVTLRRSRALGRHGSTLSRNSVLDGILVFVFTRRLGVLSLSLLCFCAVIFLSSLINSPI